MAINVTDTDRSKLVRGVLTARTESDVNAVLALAAGNGITTGCPIGNRDNNAGTIEIASNPYSAIAERVTNGLDAMLELMAQKAGYFDIEDWPTLPANPRDAAAILFDLPAGGFSDLIDAERRQLAANVAIMLEESGEKQRPTIIVEDRGIGQHPLEMPDGLLSLNRSNKLRKPWQHGSYGQGGSATLRFAPFTLFISRKEPSLLAEAQPDVVGWTIAYRDEGDPYKEALPVYKYLVESDSAIPTFEPSLLPNSEWHGTRVVHISYDLSRYSQAFTQLKNGIWGMFHALLFDPVLPFLVGGRRQIDLDVAAKKGAVADDDMSDFVVAEGDPTRVISGNRIRLNAGPKGKDPEIAWRGADVRDLTKAYDRDLGKLRISYWVVRRPLSSSRKTDPTLGYVAADSAVTVTLNGQRHGAERRGWLKDNLGLPYLAKNLIVQVDIDDLSPPARRQLFSSSREQMVDGPMKALIYSETIASLSADNELRNLENEMRDRAMAKGAEQVGEHVRKKLERFINTFLKDKTKKVQVAEGTGSDTNNPTPKPPGPPPEPRTTDDSHLPAEPSDIKFDRDPIEIVQGKRTTVWVYVDAKNGYLERHAEDLKVSFSANLAGKVLDVSRSELLAGKSRWTLKAESDAPLGDGEMEAVLVTSNGIVSATSKLTVVAPPKTSKRKPREKDAPAKGPNIVWVTRDEWDSDFNEKTVGEVNIGTDNTDIRVNRHHPRIDRVLNNKTLSEGEIKRRENRYLFAIGCGLFRQEYAMQAVGARPDDPVIQGEQDRMAEAVLIAIDEQIEDLD
jgi:hypothetical protein